MPNKVTFHDDIVEIYRIGKRVYLRLKGHLEIELNDPYDMIPLTSLNMMEACKRGAT